MKSKAMSTEETQTKKASKKDPWEALGGKPKPKPTEDLENAEEKQDSAKTT